jgi:hypothetical protein
LKLKNANTGVGRAVIAFGKAGGYRIINLVRRTEAVPEVEAAGGEVVLLDDDAAPDRIAEIVSGGTAWEIQYWSAFHHERGPDSDAETLEFFLTGLVDSARCVKTSKLGSTCSISTTTSVSGATRNKRARGGRR